MFQLEGVRTNRKGTKRISQRREYCGKTATIVDVFKDLDGESDATMYRIDLDHRDWNWTDEMFEPERVEDVKDPEE